MRKFSNSGNASAFEADTGVTTKETALSEANKTNEEIAAEGFVLLKNRDVTITEYELNWATFGNVPKIVTKPALPFPKQTGGFDPWIPGVKNNVSVFGKNSVNAVYGGSGSSGGTGGGVDIYQSLANAGYTVNPTLKAFYASAALSGAGRPSSPGIGQANVVGFPVGETPVNMYAAAPGVVDSYTKDYKDVAIVMISRIGGEGYDLPRTSIKNSGGNIQDAAGATITSNADLATKAVPVEGRTDLTEHYLELDNNEKAMLQMVKAVGFGRVIVVINASEAMELGFINDDAYGIDAAIMIGSTGGTGMNALGKVLSGTVNPSGRTVDTFASDFTKDPTWNNLGDNMKQGLGTAPSGNEYRTSVGARHATRSYEVSYEEGIYVGYRYYETRGYTEKAANANSTWYKDNVVYPFGYGLSYTTFNWEIVSSSPANNATLTANGKIEVNVKVTNTGSVAGKDVVQLYYSAPYTTGKIEKAHVVLGAFEKTPLIDPGASATVKLSLSVKDMASYDYSDANGNGHSGYELDGGAYKLFIGKNANDAWSASALNVNYTIAAAGIKYTDNFDGSSKVENRFDDVSEKMEGKTLSRSNWTATWPTVPTADELIVDAAWIAALNPAMGTAAEIAAYDTGMPWYTAAMPSQRETALTGTEDGIILLSDMIGLDYNDAKWTAFLNQFTISQLVAAVGAGFFTTGPEVKALGITETATPDGPTGFTGNMAGRPASGYPGTCFYVSPYLVACTWNRELAELEGIAMGNEGIIHGFSGIYAPAMNTHRSPFSGRNFEYYSEDGVLSGKIGAAVVKGMQSKGVIPFVKHFALNDQETNRDTNGLLTWADEQTMREIYLKTFQIAVEEGGALGIMSSFNRIGKTWAGASYALLT